MAYRLCPPCDNAVPVIYVEGDGYCQYCYDAYPDLADPIC